MRRRWGRRATTAALLCLAAVYLLPFLVQLATSLKSDAQATADPLSLIPRPLSTAAWSELIAGGTLPIGTWLTNSVLVAAVVTPARVLFDAMAGYALSRLRFAGRDALLGAVLAVMSVPGVALLVPRFLIVTYLGIYDTYAAMLLPLLVDAAGVFIMKQFFDSVPLAIEEAARLDGAGTLRTFWSVVLPMSRPALVTVAVLSFQGSWNEFGHFLVTTGSPEHETLVTGLAGLTAGGLGAGSMYPLKMAAALVTTVPVAVVFFCFQRHLVPGGREGTTGG